MQQVISRWVMRSHSCSKLQTIDRGLRQRRGVLFEPAHAHRRVGEIAALIEALGIGAVTFRQIAWREARVAVLDP